MASIRKRPGRPKPWEVRGFDPALPGRTRSFERKVDAQRFRATAEADQARGTWLDPAAGKVLFGAYAEQWLAQQQVRDSSLALASAAVNALRPTFGTLPLATIRPSHVKAWVRGLHKAPRTVRAYTGYLRMILDAAAEDRLIASNPAKAKGVKLPKVPRTAVIPWTHEQVQAVADAHPDRWRALALTVAGTGMRQGEAFGLRVCDVDFFGNWVHVRQQIQDGRAVPLKTDTSYRSVPIAETTKLLIAEHLRAYPPDGTGEPETIGTGGLVFTALRGGPLRRSRFNERVWRPALRTARLDARPRRNGMHALRHTYVSTLLAAGIDLVTVAAWIGDTPQIAMATYAHLVPDQDERGREAIEATFGARVGQTWARSADGQS